MEDKLYLPIGFKHEGQDVTEVELAETGGDAEKIFTKRASSSKLYSWMGQVISASIAQIGGVSVASEFFKQKDGATEIPSVIKKIPLLDVGSLMLQIQRECWEDVLENQKISCIHCGSVLEADVDLYKMPLPKSEDGKALEHYTVELSKPHKISGMPEIMDEYNGHLVNRIKFRTATLGDAIRHENVSQDEVVFWRNIAFDTIVSMHYEDKDGEITELPDGFMAKRGKLFFTKDLSTRTLKQIRSGMTKTQPSGRLYYEDECAKCTRMTPFLASPVNFFRA
tara:strand:+ start:34028 stop:34870 length:843 start_codon:yes stop_codon:yes gene_type:complete